MYFLIKEATDLLRAIAEFDIDQLDLAAMELHQLPCADLAPGEQVELIGRLTDDGEELDWRSYRCGDSGPEKIQEIRLLNTPLTSSPGPTSAQNVPHWRS